MKIKLLLSTLALGLFLSTLSQNTIELTFTAIDSTTYVQLDSIKVMNRTQGGDTVLYYPDTALKLDCQVGISETNIGAEGFQVFQNYPNPLIDQTNISFYVPEKDKVNLIVTDLSGRALIKSERILDQGYHSYRFTPGNSSLFFFTVQWRKNSSSIKILQTAPLSDNASTIEYLGSKYASPRLKVTEDIQGFLFNLGDELLYIGYIDTLKSGMLDVPETSETYSFQFATNIPCPGTPTVTYEGQVYNTIQIYSQCWLKENLNIGTMLQSNMEQSNNGTIEKYCFFNMPDSCAKYGGLYQWDEMMQYNYQQGVQGICPEGWHIPTDEEWKVLEGAVDSQYGIGSSEWDMIYNRGVDAGSNLKAITWVGNNNDPFGFSGLPGGGCLPSGYFTGINYGHWWSSTEYISQYAWFRILDPNYGSVYRRNLDRPNGCSVRCIKD